MAELLWVTAFIIGLFVIEIWYVRTQNTSISQHLQGLFNKMSKQLIAGIFFLLGSITGWMIAHFMTFGG